MRALQECKAEIFRRMEEGCKKRRMRRNRIIACGIPLCLCLVVFSAAMFQNLMPEGNTTEQADECAPVCAYSAVEITDGEDLLCATEQDAVKVQQLYDVLSGTLAVQTEALTGAPAGGSYNYSFSQNPLYGDSNESRSFRFVFSSPDGQQEAFLLAKNALTNLTSGETTSITSEVYDSILTLIL